MVRHLFKAHIFLKPILHCIYRPLVTFIECLPSDRPSAKGWIPISGTDEKQVTVLSNVITFHTTNMTNFLGGMGWGGKDCPFSSILHTKPEWSFQYINQFLSLLHFLNLQWFLIIFRIWSTLPQLQSLYYLVNAYSFTSLSHSPFAFVHNVPDSLIFILFLKFQSLRSCNFLC